MRHLGVRFGTHSHAGIDGPSSSSTVCGACLVTMPHTHPIPQVPGVYGDGATEAVFLAAALPDNRLGWESAWINLAKVVRIDTHRSLPG